MSDAEESTVTRRGDAFVWSGRGPSWARDVAGQIARFYDLDAAVLLDALLEMADGETRPVGYGVAAPPANALRAAALDYAARGWRVFPCHGTRGDGRCDCGEPRCPAAGKHPRVANAVAFATLDPAEIRAWWTRWPTANVAVATGLGLQVVDLDTPDAVARWEALRAARGGHPPTPEAETGGGGRHMYFTGAGLSPNIVQRIARDIDIRGDGGYVVAPPSVHASGARYAWVSGHGPGDRPLAPLPEWVERAMLADTTAAPSPAASPAASLATLQAEIRGRWGSSAYNGAFRARTDAARDPVHASVHIAKAVAKARATGAERYHADVAICAVRYADRFPGGPLELGPIGLAGRPDVAAAPAIDALLAEIADVTDALEHEEPSGLAAQRGRAADALTALAAWALRRLGPAVFWSAVAARVADKFPPVAP